MYQAVGLAVLLASLPSCQDGQARPQIHQNPDADRIHVRQASSLSGEMMIVVQGANNSPYFVLTEEGDTLMSGNTGPEMLWEATDQWAAALYLDKVDPTTSGPLTLVIPEVGEVMVPTIDPTGNRTITTLLGKSFFFQRCSEELDQKFAGQWARKSGHPDNQVTIHPSAATESRPAGSVVSLPGGWYDAGDYGKYCGPTSFVTWSFLHLLEANPSVISSLKTTIPGSENALPDFLDEGLVGLRFLLAVQDPDGSVPHKVTALRHAATVMPDEDLDQRFLIGQSAPTTFTFAAAMAKAARVLKSYENYTPGLADSCLQAARSAFEWAMANQSISFTNPSDVHTGEYKDAMVEDEREWARLELWITSGESQYRQPGQLFELVQSRNPFHGDATWKAMLSLTMHRNQLNQQERKDWLEQLKWRSNRMKEYARFNPYGVPIGFNEYDFNWGSNAILARQGLWWLMTAQWTGDKDWEERTLRIGDYLLGMNPLDLSFITGVGERSPQDIHHRPSYADQIAAPVPGLMVGGPQVVIKQRDCEQYPSEKPALRYLDEWCSYTTNEIAINWNATALLLFGLTSE